MASSVCKVKASFNNRLGSLSILHVSDNHFLVEFEESGGDELDDLLLFDFEDASLAADRTVIRNESELEKVNRLAKLKSNGDNNIAAISSNVRFPMVFRILKQAEWVLLEEAFFECRNVCDMSLRLDMFVRDVYFAGVYSGYAAQGDRGIPKGTDEKPFILTNKFRDIQESGQYQEIAAPESLNQSADNTNISLERIPTIGESLNGSIASNIKQGQPLRKKKIDRKKLSCFYCKISCHDDHSREFVVHPYCPEDFQRNPIYICLICANNWRDYREKADKEDMLIIAGEVNEELCCLCSDTPDELNLCIRCPRSYCLPCLEKVLLEQQLLKLMNEDDWSCMCCRKDSHVSQAPLSGSLWKVIKYADALTPAAYGGGANINTDLTTVPDRGTLTNEQMKPATTPATPKTKEQKNKSAATNQKSSVESSAAKNNDVHQFIEAKPSPSVSKSAGKSESGKHQPLEQARKKSRGALPAKSNAQEFDPFALSDEDCNLEFEIPLSHSVTYDRPPDQQFSIGDRVLITNSRGKISHRSFVGSQGVILCSDANGWLSLKLDSTGETTKVRKLNLKMVDMQEPNKATKKCDRNAVHQSPVISSKQIDSSLPPVNKELDEAFYFSQYLQFYDKLCQQCSSSRSKFITDDFCFLCKDGGDLIECDNVCRKKKCRKVYHDYCLTHTIPDEGVVWNCPRHFCDVCGSTTLKYVCLYCPISVCSNCPSEMVRLYSQNEFVEMETPSTGEFASGVVPIVCHTCLSMLRKCGEREDLCDPVVSKILRQQVGDFKSMDTPHKPANTVNNPSTTKSNKRSKQNKSKSVVIRNASAAEISNEATGGGGTGNVNQSEDIEVAIDKITQEIEVEKDMPANDGEHASQQKESLEIAHCFIEFTKSLTPLGSHPSSHTATVPVAQPSISVTSTPKEMEIPVVQVL